MSVQEGKVILRTALDEDLIMQLKIAALHTKVNPNVIVDAALRLYLNDEANLKALKANSKGGIKNDSEQINQPFSTLSPRSLKLA